MAAPSPDATPTAAPSTSVRRMHNNPIGPIAAAIAKPMAKPRAQAQISSTVLLQSCPGKHDAGNVWTLTVGTDEAVAGPPLETGLC